MEIDDRDDLHAEINRLLMAALEVDEAHVAEMTRRDELHVAETDRRDDQHVRELDRRDDLHQRELDRRQDVFDREIDTIRQALHTRDVIGQAKGIIMASTGCDADQAFQVLSKQSQAENRKLYDVAAELTANLRRRR
ncbi:MAG: ANTAR domain-containing protein [Ilumatobacteraceae bacterium]